MALFRWLPLAGLAVLCSGCPILDEGLDGTWNGSPNSGAFPGPDSLIAESGRNVTITDCEYNITELERHGDTLEYPNGTPYYLHVVDSDSLTGSGDIAGSTVTLVKVSKLTQFHAGTFNVSAFSIAPLQASADVCAYRRLGRYESSSGTQLEPEVLLVSAPYRAGFIKLSLALSEFAEGTYQLVDFETFVEDPADRAYVELTSAQFTDQIGTDFLPLESGTVQVVSTDPTRVNVQAVLSLTTGEEVTLDTMVDVTPTTKR